MVLSKVRKNVFDTKFYIRIDMIQNYTVKLY